VSGTPSAAAGGRDRSASITASELAARIPDDRTAVLEFVGGVGGAPVTVFTVGRSVFRARVLPSVESLADRVRRFSALIESGAEADGFARSLGAALLTPVLAELGPAVTRLIIVPDGPLHDVPWDALRLPDGRFVAERYAVSVAPAAGVVATLWGGKTGTSARGAARILAFGDPEFPGERRGRTREATSAAADMYALAFDSSGGLPRLRASAEEARRVARYASESDVRVRHEASAAFLKRAPLRDYRVIHVATHALVDERSAARTALALAPGGGESGFVGAGDLAALTLGADLVVLSACRTARGRIVGGEGVQGLTAPLLQAGARSVVATQWRISDRKTVSFVDDFYAGLARGLPVGDALRTAKLAAIRRGAPPGEWAAFTAVGDPFVTVPLRVPPATALARWGVALGASALVAAFVAALAAYVGYSRRTRRARIAEAR
jgi:CHAT domain-containing protein